MAGEDASLSVSHPPSGEGLSVAFPTIPYAFARRFGVVLDATHDQPMIAMRESAPIRVREMPLGYQL